MKPKKNRSADMAKNSSIYLALGLALMLFVTYQSINHKTYEKSAVDIGQLNLDDEMIEEVPITETIQTPPPQLPPPPAAPEVIEVIEDEEEVEETVIQSAETDMEEEIVEVEEIEIEEVDEVVEVPFTVIENVPVYPGCEKGNNDQKKKCMSAKIDKFIQKKFNADLAADYGLSGIQRINVIFKIDTQGNITQVRARAPHPGLAKEAQRVVSMLPKMSPGMQRGKPVIVQYTLPIRFQVQD